MNELFTSLKDWGHEAKDGFLEAAPGLAKPLVPSSFISDTVTEAMIYNMVETGRYHIMQGQFADAEFALRSALLARPELADAWASRAVALMGLGAHFDAICCLERALELMPEVAEYYSNKGLCYMEFEHYDMALTDMRKAVEMKPDLAVCHMNMGNVYRLTQNPLLAIECYNKGIEHVPNDINLKLNRAFGYLEAGLYEEGFKEYESRWQSGQLYPWMVRKRNGQLVPLWNGEDLNDKIILLHWEQGAGDTLQFVRFAKPLKDKYPDTTIYVCVKPELVRLMRWVPGVDAVMAVGTDMPIEEVSYLCPVASLPRFLDVKTPADVYAPNKYLFVEQALGLHWKDKLDKDLGSFGNVAKVGICWAGLSRPGQPLANNVDKRRSTNISQWGPVFACPGIVLVSLQMGLPAAQLAQPPVGATIADYSHDLSDFYETAALIENLDLVITVDTSVAHLAAGLGKPTWMLSRFDGCWRWLGDRRDSPWYPTLTQFRQPRPGDWLTVFNKVASTLYAKLLEREALLKRHQDQLEALAAEAAE